MQLWLCTVDFQKASDPVEHNAIWAALAEQRIDGQYIQLLSISYVNQVGQINGLSLGKRFMIERGTKRGDPLSPKLFTAVIEQIMRKLVPIW